jgi:NitT/TauT family transport system ATP-binding protein
MHQSTSIAQRAGVEINVYGVRRVFGGTVEALRNITLNVPAGQFIAIIGPSGCGKSTLLRIIAGLDRADSGTVELVGNDGTTGSIAYVFQDAHLLPWRNVLANVALPLELMDVPRGERLASARAAIESVGLADAMTRYPAQLSGGMRMRVSLARALVTEPKILLLDEPFAALDEITRQRLDEQLHQLWATRGMTVIFVTHSILEASFLAQRAVVMSRRPGRIVFDQMLELPAERVGSLRTETRFERVMRTLYEELERAEAGAA